MDNLLLSSSNSPTFSVPSTSSTKVILVRHGRTTYNEQGRYQGNSDKSILTPKGHQDAYATGLALQQYNFDAIYTSPLKRVRQTTQEILTALKDRDYVPSVYSDRLLNEICMFHWQGLSYQEVKGKFAQDYSCWQNTPHLFSLNNVSPVLELFEKAKLFWHKVLTEHRGQTILIVAHGGTNRALISMAVGLKPENYHSLQLSNCGISCLEFDSSNSFGKLQYLNDTYHLGKTLPKLKAGKTGWRWLLLSETNAQNLIDRPLLNELCSSNIDLLLTEISISKFLIQKLSANYQLSHLFLTEKHFTNWQQIIIGRQKLSISAEQLRLTTGLIIAPDKLIARILQQTFQVNISHTENVLTIIHYPHGKNLSILQGILPLTVNKVVLSK
ncbi:MAG: histidine phosphatase family protein [Pleurocapsa sp.]